MVSSIKNNKIIEPLVVYYNEEDDFYYIIIGSRRFLAAKEARLDKVPCLIRKEKPDDKDILIEALIENIHRKNLNAFEEANVYQILINEYGYTQKQIVEEFGKPKSRISEILKIDLIPKTVKEKITASEISREHLVEIARQKNEDDMLLLVREIIEKKLNIQQVRELSNKLRGKYQSETKIANGIIKDCTRLTENLEMFLNRELDIAQYNELSEMLENVKYKIDNLINKK